MKRKPESQSVKVLRYVPEQMMGAAKFKKRRRVMTLFVPYVLKN